MSRPTRQPLILAGSAARWNPVLDAGDAAKAMAVARDVAMRLREPADVENAAALAKQQTGYPRSTHWRPYSVAQGYAGLALLFGAADACMPGEGWDVAAHQHLQRAVQAAAQLPQLTHGMSSGLGGLAFVSSLLSRQGTRYRKLLQSIDAVLIHLVTSATATRKQIEHGLSVSTFDVISGFAGVGCLLLLRCKERPYRAALEAVLRFLIALTEEQDGVPHWHTPSRYIPDETAQRTYPHGNLNCGLAHGIPGPLALLSLAAISGVIVQGQLQAIRRIADWLCRYRVRDQWGVNWPTAVPLGPGGSPPVLPTIADEENTTTAYRPSRTAWCYGSPGIARSLWLAGEALDDPGYRERRDRCHAGGVSPSAECQADRRAHILPRRGGSPANHVAVRVRHGPTVVY